MSPNPALYALPYYGGKSARATTGTGAWIASLLPVRRIYVEPFAGMLGVMLQRSPCEMEVANDLDGRIVNWWRVLREDTDALLRAIDLTPNSRTEYVRARTLLDSDDPVLAAWAATVVLCQGMGGQLEGTPGNWSRTIHGNRAAGPMRDRTPMLAAIAHRIAGVTLECRDAVEVLEFYAKSPEAVIYCDPPYLDADVRPYGAQADHDALRAALTAPSVRAAIAVSGYGDWLDDAEGWHRSERRTYATGAGLYAAVEKDTRRTEALWTNYQPVTTYRLFD